MKGKRKRLLAAALAGALMLTWTPSVDAATSELEESIKQKQEAISQAQEEKKKLQSGLSDIQEMVAQLEQSKSDLETYVVELDGQLNSLEEKIGELQEQIEEKKEEIEQAKEDLDTAETVAENQYAEMKVRLRYLYANSTDDGYLTALLSAGSFSEMLNQAEYIQQVSDYDSRKLEEYRQNVEYMELCRQTLEEEEEVLHQAEESLQREQQSVNTLISEKEKQIVAYEGDISNQEAAIAEYEAQIAAEDAEIAALEKAVEADKAKLEEENKVKYDGGMFQMPCPGYTRISDDYGSRMHPILNVEKFHNGVDFAAPSGSPILAAYDGRVVAATYNSSMGNYVMIDHGDGLYTIYMHASKLYGSSGQTGTKREQIAAVGSTGRSTGPHLHFSVRLNGSYVSPWNYLQ